MTLSQTIKRYTTVWLIMATTAIQETFVNRGSNVLFLAGKCFRFAIMMGFLLVLKNNVQEIGGYTTSQMLAFYVTYQIVDVLMQTFYRGVYEFGSIVRNGNFDAVLSKPINPLFRVLAGSPDINDAIFLLPTTLFGFYVMLSSGLDFSLSGVILYLALLINSLLIGTAIHIFIVAFTLITTDIDNIIWMYRDISRLGQFPVSIYFELFKLFLFFIVPVGFMVTVPAEALLGAPLSYSVLLSFGVGIGFFLLSLWAWQRALRTYSSASS